MTWVERLKEAAYTSPSGTRISFAYEDVSREFEKRTTAFEFPEVDGTYVQDLGSSGRRYPLRIFFWGDNYDLLASGFEEALRERGIGLLEHPIYGNIDVVPFGTITRRDDLLTRANQAVIEVTFFETFNLIYPSSTTDREAALNASLSAFNEALANNFAGNTNLQSAVQGALFKNRYQVLLGLTKSGLQAIADAQDSVKRAFETIDKSINQGIDLLIATPLTLAFQTALLIQAPARALTSLKARLEAYRNLAFSIFDGDGAVVTAAEEQEFRTRELFGTTFVTGGIIAALNNDFQTRREAIEAVEEIVLEFDRAVDWRDANFASFELTTPPSSLPPIDTGELYQALQTSVALASSFLIELSFDLRTEVRITLDRPRNLIELCGELYGSIDENLDLMINSNNLTGSEILEIPKGREIVYFI